MRDKTQEAVDALWPGENTRVFFQWRIFDKCWGSFACSNNGYKWESKGYKTEEETRAGVLPELKSLLADKIKIKRQEVEALAALLASL
jgi:hypothetical protein